MQPDNLKIKPESPIQLSKSDSVGSAIDRRGFVASTGALAVAGPLGMHSILAADSSGIYHD